MTSSEVRAFAGAYISDPGLRARTSELFLFEMYVLDKARGVSPHDILRAVQDVEAGEPNIPSTKRATRFNHPPLKGLWHKHYFAAPFVPDNILNALGQRGLEGAAHVGIDQAGPQASGRDVVRQLMQGLENKLEKRSDDARLTGEWIIFVKHAGKNYYLSLRSHDSGDQKIYDHILKHCTRDFPRLESWVAEAAVGG